MYLKVNKSLKPERESFLFQAFTLYDIKYIMNLYKSIQQRLDLVIQLVQLHSIYVSLGNTTM